MTDLITVSAGAQTDIEPGVYEVTLTDISEPRTIYPQTGPNAGKEVQLRDWTFATDDGVEIRAGASTASGPKSKTYAWLTALLGGTPPAVGTSYPRDQLIGRTAIATITIDDGGWPRISGLSAMPKARAAAPAAAAPAAATPVAAAAGSNDDLPF
jgi:hypothetical protein